MKRLQNIYQDIKILILMIVSFTNIYVYWILNSVSLTVSYFEDLHVSSMVVTFLYMGTFFCYWI